MGIAAVTAFLPCCLGKSPSWTELHRELFADSDHVLKNFSNPYGLKPIFDKYPHSNLLPDFFVQVINLHGTAPQFVVEVGSLYGHSALSMGAVLDNLGLPNVPILCIDPFTGDLNMLLARHKDPIVRAWSTPTIDGRSLTFDQFMVNVQFAISRSLSPFHIIPLHATSIIGARWLRDMNYTPDIIFIDSAHEEDETYLELKSYYEVLAPAGILFGDDYGWEAVRKDVDRFAAENPTARFEVVSATAHSSLKLWLMQKEKL